MQGKSERKKIHAQRIAQEKFSCIRKNIPAREMLTEKNSCSSKIPHNFSNGSSLNAEREQCDKGNQFIPNEYTICIDLIVGEVLS